MKNKFFIYLKFALLRENGTVSMTKVWTWLAGFFAIVVSSQGIIQANGIDIPPSVLPYFKWAGIISGIIALIKTRNAGK